MLCSDHSRFSSVFHAAHYYWIHLASIYTPLLEASWTDAFLSCPPPHKMCFSLLWALINHWTCCYYSNYNILLWWSVYLSISLRKGYPSLSKENVWLHCLSLNPGTFSSIEFVLNKSLLNWSDLRNCLSLGSPSQKSLTWGLQVVYLEDDSRRAGMGSETGKEKSQRKK